MPLANDSDILIVNTPPMNTTMPPLGAAYLLEFLRKNGVNAEVFDLNISLYGKAADKSLWNIDALNYYEAFQVGQILLMDLIKK